MKRKTTSILLTICIMLTLLPTTAWAGSHEITDTAVEMTGGNIYIRNNTIIDADADVAQVIIPDGVTSIGNSAFSGCSGLTSVTIPDSVTTIGEYAFNGCGGLTSITIPDRVTSIGEHAFWFCDGLTNIIIPNSVTSIGEYAFSGCSRLKSVTIPNSVKSISGFDGCSGLTSIIIPDGITSIGESAFNGCSGLTSVTIPNSVTSIGFAAFRGCSGLTNITIPNSVTSIGDQAFYDCSGLTNITIPDGVTSIGYSAFCYCSELKSVTISNSVTSIGVYAFTGCDNLKDVYYSGNEMQWNNIIIDDENDPLTNATIHYSGSSGDEQFPDGIAIFSTEKSMTVKTGDSMWLSFGLIINDKFVGDWKRMAIVVSDPTIISLSEYEETEYGYVIQINGKKQGSTNITISDAESGLSRVIVITVQDSYVEKCSYSIDNMPTFYPNNNWENTIETNIYNLNGLYMNNYKCIENGDHYDISFDIYNSQYHTGAVDIYDANGNWIDCEEIPKYKMISSLWDTRDQYYYLVTDLLTGKLLTYEQASFAKHKFISFEVPCGGYFTISNNFAESPGTFLFNSSDIVFDGTCTLIKLIKADDINTTAFSGLIKEKVVNNTSTRKKFIEIFKDTIQDQVRADIKKVFQNDINNAYSGISSTFEETWNLLFSDISWKTLFEEATGIGESAFIKFAGPAGIALNGCFAFTKGGNRLLQAVDLATSVDAPLATVYSSINEGYINPWGVIINTNNNIDADVKLHVFRISNNNTIEIILGESDPDHLKKYELYNICFVKNDQLVQPNGKVTVYMPIPKGMQGDTCNIYRQEDDGHWTILSAHIENNYLVFETDHFSLYAIAGIPEELSITSLPDKLSYHLDETLQTDGLVLNLDGTMITNGFLCEPTVFSELGTQKIIVRYGITFTEFNVTVIEKDIDGGTSSGTTGNPDNSDNTESEGNGNIDGTDPSKPSAEETPDTPPETSLFTDVSSDAWYYDAVKFVSENKLMNGTGNGLFSPNVKLSRAMLAQILYNKAGNPTFNGDNTFLDVKSDAWYANAVNWAAAEGIVTGYGNGNFGPNDAITREQLVLMLWRQSGTPAFASKDLNFNDTEKVSDWASDAVYWAVENGLIVGQNGNYLVPDGSASRAETATVLMRLYSENNS